MTKQLSGVVQVPRRCPVRSGAGTRRSPANCPEWCRYPAGALTGVRSGAEIGLVSLRLGVSHGASLGDFLLAPACPIEKVTLWEGFLYLTSGSETDEGVTKDKRIEPGAPGPKPSIHYPLGYRFTLNVFTIVLPLCLHLDRLGLSWRVLRLCCRLWAILLLF